MSGLAIHGLGVRYGSGADKFQALTNINLQIAAGTFVTLLGPSGSGKTTLLRCVAGLISPGTGRITADDRLFYDADSSIGLPTRHRNLGMVFQAFALWPHMCVADNIAFPLKMHGWPAEKIKARVNELLVVVGLPGLGSRYPGQLSGGQQQRVGLARAIACEPTMLLMDEPLSSLDARLREEMRSHIRRLQKDLGITVIYVTHDREEALGLSDVIVILSAGRIVSTGAPRELYQTPPDSFSATFLAGWNLLGKPDDVVAGSEGRWLAHVVGASQFAAGNNCAALLPVDINEKLSVSTGGSDTHVPCEVMNVEFLGAATRIELRLPGIDPAVFVTQTGSAGEAALNLRRGMRVDMPIRAFRILPQPDGYQPQAQGGHA